MNRSRRSIIFRALCAFNIRCSEVHLAILRERQGKHLMESHISLSLQPRQRVREGEKSTHTPLSLSLYLYLFPHTSSLSLSLSLFALRPQGKQRKEVKIPITCKYRLKLHKESWTRNIFTFTITRRGEKIASLAISVRYLHIRE